MLRKQWIRLINRLRRRWAATVELDGRRALAEELAQLEATSFSTKPPGEATDARLLLVGPEEFDHVPVGVATIYLVNLPHGLARDNVSSLAIRGRRVVVYEVLGGAPQSTTDRGDRTGTIWPDELGTWHFNGSPKRAAHDR